MRSSLLGILCLFLAQTACAKEVDKAKSKLILFHSSACQKCVKVMQEFMPEVEKRFGERVNIEYRDIADIENYKLLIGLKQEYGLSLKEGLPVVFFNGEFLFGEKEIRRGLFWLIEKEGKALVFSDKTVKADLIPYFLKFTLPAVLSAGLIDGINPCAFTVVIFFISFLSLQGYRKKELVGIGIFYILAVFITYLLLGLGIFGFLYRLRGFWLISRIINLSVAVLSIILGVFCLYDLFKFKKTKTTEGLILQLPKAVKNQIQRIIGWHYRKTPQIQMQPVKKQITRLILSAFITGFLISLLEAACTGQVYLPAITFVLKAAPLKLKAFGYLVLYNLMFILPLILIFILSLAGFTSQRFSSFFRKHFLSIKVVMTILFFTLGILLIWRA